MAHLARPLAPERAVHVLEEVVVLPRIARRVDDEAGDALEVREAEGGRRNRVVAQSERKLARTLG